MMYAWQELLWKLVLLQTHIAVHWYETSKQQGHELHGSDRYIFTRYILLFVSVLAILFRNSLSRISCAVYNIFSASASAPLLSWMNLRCIVRKIHYYPWSPKFCYVVSLYCNWNMLDYILLWVWIQWSEIIDGLVPSRMSMPRGQTLQKSRLPQVQSCIYLEHLLREYFQELEVSSQEWTSEKCDYRYEE